MQPFVQSAASLLPIAKLACAALGLLAIHAAFNLLETNLPRRFHQLDARYRVRKFVVFAGYVVALLFVTILFEDRLGRIALALGVAGAGLVVALLDPIASIADWLAISWAHLYSVGDRIQLGETTGDVIDISFMRTTIVETGNQATG